ncbi:amidohydrolase [Zhihengliuella salsuginis]|uniref:Amidohydrolase n=1 Tax=Zhihengliuella salsuginis TaxID=578222 RepID=A0ABQ3GKK6_9MICC|nr:amidohydrolase family protein [Zhihengliuella salsuginis]GHD12696.1 amidohydrolase [Zhihengliuella salsuginis]
MSSLVMYRNGSVYSPADPLATAMLVDGGTVAWIGQEAAAAALIDDRMTVVDLDGGLVAPAFFDSHVHLTEVGASLEQLDLRTARSAEEVLGAVRAASEQAPGEAVLGFGWDETLWDEPRLPSVGELEAAAAGAEVYLARVDVHSALVAGPQADGLRSTATAHVTGDAHRSIRDRATDYDDATRRRYLRAALGHFARNGYAGVAEMAAPQISGRRDAELLQELVAADPAAYPLVRIYWAELAATAADAEALAEGFGPYFAGLGGDLNIDGSIGSRTAALRSDYSDAPGERGTLLLSPEQISAHVVACTRAGVQAGFHVIGDAGADAAAEGFRRAAAVVGEDALQRLGHRLEHAEMVDDDVIAALLASGVTVSLQPAFDALWGGPGGLYASRLGPERSLSMNEAGRFLAAGIPVCLGSDAPVTVVDPWAGVKACLNLSTESARISARAAFLAHTRSGYRAAGVDIPFGGQLVPGGEATFAVWSPSEMMVQTPDTRVASWSTDARAGTPLLPVLENEFPRCLRTVRAGEVLFAVDDPSAPDANPASRPSLGTD